MTPTERWQRTRAIFEQALDLPPVARAEFVAGACGNDVEIRRQVEELLAADASDTSTLPGDDETLGWLQAHIESMLRGTTIGSCRIVRVLGSGGMGTVYEAEQDHPRRTVALKVMRPGVDEQLHLEYFHREAELLASLRHPHVAQVYSAGVHEETVEGRAVRMAYLVMEPVEDAKDIVAYAESHGLGTRARIDLLLAVADALSQAHRRGLVHRDVKPSNLLVDGHGNVKVIDFGIAHMMGSAPADGATAGTLRYMSPEQQAGAATPDIRADVYSLGIVLGELLTDDDSEIEWIRKKATCPDPEGRYDNAGDFAQDLRKRLANFPLDAVPASAVYRARKFVRRHRLLVAAAAIAVISAIAGVGGLAAGYVEARAQREAAEARAAEAEAVVEFIQKMLVAAQPWHGGGEVTVHEFLERSAKSIDAEFADQPGVAAVLHQTIGWSFRGIGKPLAAEPSLTRAVELMKTLPTSRPRQILVAEQRLALVMSELGKTAEAADMVADVAERAERLLGPDDDITLAALDLRAICLSTLGRAEEAAVILKRVIEISDRRFGDKSKASMAHRNNLVSVLARLGRYKEAAEQASRVEDTMIESFGRAHPDTLVTMQNRAALLYLTRDYVQSEELTRKVLEHCDARLGAENTQTVLSRYWLGAALNGQERFADARAILEPLVPIVHKVQGTDHSYALKTEIELAKALAGQGERAEAIRIARGVEQRLAGRTDVSSKTLRNEVSRLLGGQKPRGK